MNQGVVRNFDWVPGHVLAERDYGREGGSLANYI